MEIRHALQQAAGRLNGDSGHINRLEAEVLLSQVLGVSRSFLFANPDLRLTGHQIKLFQNHTQRRLSGEPIAYITGLREFWSLPLAVTPDVLIPRPETELIVETTLDLLPDRPGLRVADLGTGSGAIALAIASERPMWDVHATEVSAGALRLARRNADELGLNRVRFHLGSWNEPLDGRFELLASNPPYVPAGDPHLHLGDCRYEPPSALCGGVDGLEAIREIIVAAGVSLADNGWLVLEHGHDQGAAVAEFMGNKGFSSIATLSDLAGLDRVTVGQIIQL